VVIDIVAAATVVVEESVIAIVNKSIAADSVIPKELRRDHSSNFISESKLDYNQKKVSHNSVICL
jgi:hypothetical protein